MSRINNSFKNVFFNVSGQILTLVLSFVTRTVLIKTLGIEYAGINGLISSIISMLSLTELGIGTAIIYNLYQPLAVHDEEKVRILMKFYKTAYRIISFVIMVGGIMLMPFLPIVIKDDVSFVNIYLVFGFYLLQTVSTYMLAAYKSGLLKADQKEYIISQIGYVFTIVTNIFQIGVLVIFNNYIWYIATVVIFNLLKNIVIAIKTDQLYPYLKKRESKKLSKKECRETYKNCFAIFIYKINAVIVNATGNMILSKFIGIVVVGLYSNYKLIMTSIKNIINIGFQSITASLGNLHVNSSEEHEFLIFKAINYLSAFCYAIFSVGTICVCNEFVKLWLGKDFLLSEKFVLLMAIDLYLYGLKKALEMFRTSMGLFQQAKYRPLIGIFLNIIFSLLFVRNMGIYGIVAANILADLLTFVWMDPYVIFKNSFQKHSLFKFYLKMIFYITITIFCALLAKGVTAIIPLSGVMALLVYGSMSVIITCIIFILASVKLEEYKYLKEIFITMIKKKVKRK